METVRLHPTVPDWLKAAIDPDCIEVGTGPRKLGGDQAVIMAALLLYLRLPRADRLRLARMISARDERSVVADLETHWISKAIDAISELGEGSVVTLESAVQAVRQMRAESALSSRSGSAADHPGGAGRRSKQRRPA